MVKNSSLIGYTILFLVALAMPVLGDNIDDENKSLSKNPKDFLFSNGKGVDNKLPTFSNQPVLYERGPEWNDYINPNGSHTRKIYTGLKNYKNGNRYEPIDTTIVEENGRFKVEKGAYKVHWSNSNNFKFKKDNYFFTYQGNKISQGKSKRDLGSFREVKGQKDKNKLKFKDVSPSIDVEYIYYPNLLKENIILKKAPDLPDDMNDTLDFSGFVKYSNELDVWANDERQDDSFSTSGAIEFRAGDKVEFFLPPPVIEDSNNSRVTGEYEFVREKGRNQLFVKVPYEWLINSSRTYPVIVDPVINIGNTADTFVDQSNPSKNYGRDETLEVQSYNGKNKRILLKFPLTRSTFGFPSTESLLNNVMVSSAKLKMNSYQTSKRRTIDVWSVDDPWVEYGIYGVTWNSQPSHKIKLSSISSGQLGWNTWPITSEVQNKLGRWINLKVMDSSEDASWWERDQLYYSWEYYLDLDPFLEVIYTVPTTQNDCGIGDDASNTKSGANFISTPKSCNGFLYSSDRYDYYKFTVTKGSTIDVSVTPLNGADFDLYLYNPSGSEKASSRLGGDSTDSISYVADSSGDWRIRIFQYSGSGDYSLSINVIDNTPPTAPVILSSTHKYDYKWHSNNDPSFTWTTPYDASGIAGYSYSFDHASSTTPDKTVDTTGNSKSYSNRFDGIRYFHVRAKDNAGNWGEAGHYKVKIDTTSPSISISTPADNAVLSSKDVSVYWSGSDSNSGISYYEIKLDTGSWIYKGMNANHIFNNVDGGTHKVYVKAVDNVANLHTENVDFTIKQSLPDLSISSSDITFIKVGGN